MLNQTIYKHQSTVRPAEFTFWTIQECRHLAVFNKPKKIIYSQQQKCQNWPEGEFSSARISSNKVELFYLCRSNMKIQSSPRHSKEMRSNPIWLVVSTPLKKTWKSVRIVTVPSLHEKTYNPNVSNLQLIFHGKTTIFHGKTIIFHGKIT